MGHRNTRTVATTPELDDELLVALSALELEEEDELEELDPLDRDDELLLVLIEN
jgi:hypothetical protein